MSGPATTSVSNNRPSFIRCKAVNSVTVTEIPVQLEPMLTLSGKSLVLYSATVLADIGCSVYMRSRSTQTTSTFAESAPHESHGNCCIVTFPEKGCGP